MKNTSIKTMLICIMTFVSFFSRAQQSSQQEEPFKHRYIGVGVRAPGIQVSDFDYKVYPGSRIILDVNSNQYFRIEGQWGMYSKTEESSESDNTDLHTKASYIGLGLMGMYPKGRARFIGGFRYGISDYSYEELHLSSTAEVVKNSGKIKVLSFLIGGEYFLAKFFSLGAEFSVSSAKDEFSPASSSSSMQKSTITEGNLIFRFYPF
jgi:hypothetical protein